MTSRYVRSTTVDPQVRRSTIYKSAPTIYRQITSRRMPYRSTRVDTQFHKTPLISTYSICLPHRSSPQAHTSTFVQIHELFNKSRPLPHLHFSDLPCRPILIFMQVHKFYISSVPPRISRSAHLQAYINIHADP